MVQVLVVDVDMRASYGRSADETGQLSEALFTFLLCTSSFFILNAHPQSFFIKPITLILKK
jgi:hypothetical protein